MTDVIDNTEINKLLEILETLEDDELATSLLSEFNEATKRHGKIVLNRDPQLSNDDWKKKCDAAQKEVELIVERILSYG